MYYFVIMVHCNTGVPAQYQYILTGMDGLLNRAQIGEVRGQRAPGLVPVHKMSVTKAKMTKWRHTTTMKRCKRQITDTKQLITHVK